jgi:cephalosporin hydroxylase
MTIKSHHHQCSVIEVKNISFFKSTPVSPAIMRTVEGFNNLREAEPVRTGVE